jgi:hypothetical protein
MHKPRAGRHARLVYVEPTATRDDQFHELPPL